MAQRTYTCDVSGETAEMSFPAGVPVPNCPPGWIELEGLLISDKVASLTLIADGKEIVIRKPKEADKVSKGTKTKTK